jgi:glutamyl-tRNA synthetase
LDQVADLLRERAKTLIEMAESAVYFYQDFDQFDENAAKKHLRPVAAEALALVMQKMAALETWQTEAIHQVIQDTADELNIGMGKVGMPLRVAITGGGQSPSIDATAALIGQARCLKRLQMALDFIAARAAV